MGSLLHSYIVAQVFGLYFVIVSVIFLSRADYYKALFKKQKAPGLEATWHGIMFLMPAILLVVTHNIWELSPRIGVTVISWMFLIRSILFLAAPVRVYNWMKKLWSGNGHRVLFSFLLFLGIYFMSRGFYLFAKLTGNSPEWMLSIFKT